MDSKTAVSPAAKREAGALLNEVELSALLGVSLPTLRNWRWKKEGPRYVKLGARCVRYRPEDVEAFIDGTAKGPEELSGVAE